MMKKAITITAVATFVATSLLWAAVLIFIGQRGTVDLDASQAAATNSYSEMEASSNATLYDKDGNWIGTGMLVETSKKAYLQMDRERYELTCSDREGYRYLVSEEKIYVK